MDEKKKERRKKLLVEKNIQLRHLGLLIVSFLIILILVEVHIYSLVKSMVPKLSYLQDLPYLKTVTIILMFEIFLIIVIMGLINIFYTHRLVGPVSRVTKEIQRMREKNEFHTLTIRKKDELKTLITEINKLINIMNKK